MNQMESLKDKEIVILGLARSGVAVAKLLHQQGAKLIVNDSKPVEQCPEATELMDMGIEVICGGHPEGIIHSDVHFVVKNPGIPYRIQPLVKAMELNIPIYTEIEISSWFITSPIIGITGSNGKTTTTTLIGAILEAGGCRSVVAGNIGVPLSEVAMQHHNEQWIVTELSSFQLKGTERFRPHIALLLNLSPAHLDYHGDMTDYEQSKLKLFANQHDSDFAILNADNEGSYKWKDSVKGKLMSFSRLKQLAYGVYVDNHKIVYRNERGTVEPIMDVKDVSLKGEHNVENVLAAICAALACGIDKNAIAHTVAHFAGVEHRLEYVRTVEGVDYINDSKATNPVAAMMSIRAVEQPIVLIAGGLDRGIDFMEMLPLVRERIKALVCYGQTKNILYDLGQKAGLHQLRQVDNVSEAVLAAKAFAEKGDVVLLSPACASWDMYSSFEQRGRMFKESVHNL